MDDTRVQLFTKLCLALSKIRTMPKVTFSLLLICMSHFILSAQSEQQLKNELDKRGITSLEQVQVELRKRGMTEEDARRQAKLYGLSYDDYIAKYLIGQKVSTTGTLQEIQSIGIDTIGYTAEIDDINAQVAPTISVEPTPENLPYYGYEIFSNNPFTDQQSLVSNIDPGYHIGPGDELRVYLWGEAEFQFEGKVDLNGNLFIPNVGQVFVSGTSYENLNNRLRQYLSKFYAGLITSPAQVFLDVSLTKLRATRILVMGESNRPGSHFINAFATTLNSLYISGGVKTTGSLREIKVFRNSKLISTIDLYDYLIKGTLSEDIRLVNNDVVFLPTRLNSISLSGEVNKPGIFELKDNEGLFNIIQFAGGLKPTAYTKSITIKRIKTISNRGTEVFDREILTLDYNELLSKGENVKLQDGDEIIFSRVLDKFSNLITVSGSVFRPGDYELEPASRIRDLINRAGGLRPNTYLNKIDLFRKDNNGDLKFRSLSLSSILDSESSVDNIILQSDDSLKVYNEDELKSLETVSIEGFVSEPKTILWRENLTLYDLVFMAANVEDLEYSNRVLTSRADLLRYVVGQTDYQIIPFNLDNVLDKRFNAVLRPKDRVILYSKDITETLDKTISINGAVKNEGRYLLTDSMTVEDLIIQAGGFVRTSFRDSVSISREKFDFTGNRISEVTRVPLDQNYMLGTSLTASSDFLLQHNDQITVNFIPGSGDIRKVSLEGEVKFPGGYVLESKGEKLSKIVERAGGFSPNVNFAGAQLYRNGRLLALDFKKLFVDKNPNFDIILSNNDRIVFPEASYTITIEGQVSNPSLQKYNEGEKVRSYLKNAGGKTRDGRRIYVTDPNGFTRKVGFLANPKVKDGSVITVIPKRERIKTESGKFLESFGTIAAIVSSTLTSILLIDRLGN